ncbi:MAG: MoaD/ThiS family protein [Candidatus Rokubacteria bacterium]|nr:MoaD/ThiS family protein [Candidatus Rokubacteria bacterium]
MRATDTLSITIEVTTWVTRCVGGDGSGSRLFEEPVTADDTLRTLLRRWSARFPELEAALWNPARTDLGEHIEVHVNDAGLGVTHQLDSPLQGGERVTLLGQFMGGAPVCALSIPWPPFWPSKI